jgi:Putative Flp pilus-assembly TadE/G-like
MLEDRESGQSIIIIALVVIVLLALVALVVDVGNAYAHRRMVQNAADAAALAGARRLAERSVGKTVLEIQVLRDVQRYAELNGLKRDAVQSWFINADGDRLETIDPFLGPAPRSAEGVEVAGDLPFITYFAHLLGFRTMTASTLAKAWVLFGPCSGDNLFPIIFDTNIFTNTTEGPEFGHVYTLWDKMTKEAPGNFGWIYWEDGNGVNHCPYEDCPQGPQTQVLGPNVVDNSRSGGWSVGDWIHGDVGVNFQPMLDELTPYIIGDPWPEVIVPLFDQVVRTGNNAAYHISGFAAFKLRCAFSSKGHYIEHDPGDCAPCAKGGSDDKCVRGEFVRTVVPSGQDGCLDTGIAIPSFRKPQ